MFYCASLVKLVVQTPIRLYKKTPIHLNWRFNNWGIGIRLRGSRVARVKPFGVLLRFACKTWCSNPCNYIKKHLGYRDSLRGSRFARVKPFCVLLRFACKTCGSNPYTTIQKNTNSFELAF